MNENAKNKTKNKNLIYAEKKLKFNKTYCFVKMFVLKNITSYYKNGFLDI